MHHQAQPIPWTASSTTTPVYGVASSSGSTMTTHDSPGFSTSTPRTRTRERGCLAVYEDAPGRFLNDASFDPLNTGQLTAYLHDERLGGGSVRSPQDAP